MGSRSRALAGIIAILLPEAAEANAVCDLVARAMLLVHEQPAVHQKTMDGQPPRIQAEAISLKDALYVREGGEGPWRRVGVDQAKRREMAAEGLKRVPLSDCAAQTTIREGSVSLDIYTYRQPNPLKGEQLPLGTIWIGPDGLPRRIGFGETSYQTMEYGDVSAPSEVVEPRQRRAPR